MPRIARIVETGSPHHICQRGNNRQVIFKDDLDRRQYLQILEKSSHKYGLKILAYCLMNNHVHLVVIPEEIDTLLQTFRKLNTAYSYYFNKKYFQDGHLWKERYFSAVLDSRYLVSAVRYIERNPVRAGIVKEIEAWIWSTAKHHLGHKNPSQIIIDDFFKYCEITRKQWESYIKQKDLPSHLRMFRGKQGNPK
ncbi:MAG: transposase [Candidatus Firestonebacteria bacterium]